MQDLQLVQIRDTTSDLLSPVDQPLWSDHVVVAPEHFVQLAFRAVLHKYAVTRSLRTNASESKGWVFGCQLQCISELLLEFDDIRMR